MNHKTTICKGDVMKSKHGILAAVMIVAITGLVQAQTFYPVLKTFSAADIGRMDKIYAISLHQMNDGLVESVLAIITKVKMDLPAENLPAIRDAINDLANHASSPMIRYRASLVGAVFANPERYRDEATDRYNDPEAFFNSLAETRAKTLSSTY